MRYKISFHDSDLSSLAPNVQNSLTMGPWYRSVVNMLEAVLEKGCTELHASGGTHISKLYGGHSLLHELSESTQSEGMARSF
jgi:hypothetical protein